MSLSSVYSLKLPKQCVWLEDAPYVFMDWVRICDVKGGSADHQGTGGGAGGRGGEDELECGSDDFGV